MRRAAKVFMNNRSQAVRLPKEFQFTTREVFIRKEGGYVILSPRATDWSSYLDEAPVASDEFMTTVDRPVVTGARALLLRYMLDMLMTDMHTSLTGVF